MRLSLRGSEREQAKPSLLDCHWSRGPRRESPLSRCRRRRRERLLVTHTPTLGLALSLPGVSSLYTLGLSSSSSPFGCTLSHAHTHTQCDTIFFLATRGDALCCCCCCCGSRIFDITFCLMLLRSGQLYWESWGLIKFAIYSIFFHYIITYNAIDATRMRNRSRNVIISWRNKKSNLSFFEYNNRNAEFFFSMRSCCWCDASYTIIRIYELLRKMTKWFSRWMRWGDTITRTEIEFSVLSHQSSSSLRWGAKYTHTNTHTHTQRAS